jgi:hypothetical protein
MAKTKISLLVACGVLTICLVIPAFAALKTKVPSQVCGSLNSIGLNTRGWKNQYDDVYFCASDYKEIGSGFSRFSLPNNLAFYAEGKRSTVSQVKLVLNVNNRASADSAHKELWKAAEVLCVKVVGMELPRTLKQAIQSGRKRSARVGPSKVEVIRENWPTGKGYEVQVIVH